jgi:DNA-binding response OmpR family regulator
MHQATSMQTAARTGSGESSASGQDGAGITILLAEDDPDLRAMLCAVLRRDGHHVVELSDGADLFDSLQALLDQGPQKRRAQLVVADLRMPVMDGLAVLRAFRARGLRQPFILMTGFGDPRTHASAWELGALAVFDKPFDFGELRRAVGAYAQARLLL